VCLYPALNLGKIMLEIPEKFPPVLLVSLDVQVFKFQTVPCTTKDVEKRHLARMRRCILQ
jgi:hypothetical protein